MRTSCKQYIEGSWARIEDNECVLIDLTREYKLEYSGMLPLYTRLLFGMCACRIPETDTPEVRDVLVSHTSQFPSFLVSRVVSKGYVSVPKGDAPVLLGHMIIASNNGCTYILSTISKVLNRDLLLVIYNKA